MFVRTFYPDRFLADVYGTDPFLLYCEKRGIPFEQVPGGIMRTWDSVRWSAALAQLPGERRRAIEWELAAVNELADPESLAHLVAAAAGRPLPSEFIPGDAPLALWFFLNDSETFHEVFLHREILDAEAWCNARAPPTIALDAPQDDAAALASALREFFQEHAGVGRFCRVEAHRLRDAYCFVAHVADRPRLFEVFSEDGEFTRLRLRPDLPVLFAYYPQDGTILLNARCRAAGLIFELVRLFARVVLRVELEASCKEQLFDLDLLKGPFRPLPDAEDMEQVRIRSLHLRYPERRGRRQVKLETVAGDAESAIAELLEAHVGGAAVLDDLQVCYAELQVVMRLHGRSTSHFIRLWPNRSNLNQTPLAERFRACLQRWGLSRAR